MGQFIPFIMGIIFILSFKVSWAQMKSNPDISLNGLFTYKAGSLGNGVEAEEKNGFGIQELELRLTTNIDPFWRGDVTVAIHEEEEVPGEPEFHVEPEEAFVESLNFDDFTLKFGKFYPQWGRHNTLHTHAFPFIDAPLVNTTLFGEEGLNESGAAIAYLLPAPWYLEVVGQVLSATNSNVFGSPSQDDVAGIYFIKNFWDLSSETTFEVDLGYGHGRNDQNQLNHIYNGAVTLKWRPVVKGEQRSVVWTTEYSHAEKVFTRDDQDNVLNLGRVGGWSSWVQFQLQKKWWLQARLENLDQVTLGNTQTKSSLLIGFVPTEYSALRLQYDHSEVPSALEAEQRITLQLNVSMGAHPAHSY